MASSEPDNSEFADIKKYFSDSEWKDLSSDEKKRYRNAKANYYEMQRCGLAPKPPPFMANEQPLKRQIDDVDSDDERDEDWSPPTDYVAKAQARLALVVPTMTIKDNVVLVPTTFAAWERHVLSGASASAAEGAAPAPPAPQASPAGDDAATGTSAATRPRYPRRSDTRMDYMEPKLRDDDLLFCDDCGREWEGDCPTHGALKVIPDTEVAVGHPERALLTVPRQLVVRVSKFPAAEPGRRGVWTRQPVPRRTRFGPYEGDIAPANKEASTDGTDGEPRDDAVDALDDMTSSNWMRFVNCARRPGEENLVPFQFKGHLYYRTVGGILAKTKLLLPEAYNDPVQDKRAISNLAAATFPCEQCDLCFSSPLFLAQHLRASLRCSGEQPGAPGDGTMHPAGGEEHPEDIDDPTQGEGQGGAAVREATEAVRHRCATCGENFRSSSGLKGHMRAHLPSDNPHKCETCGAAYKSEPVLKDHMRAAHGLIDRPYKCETCGAAYATSVNLRIHVGKHTGEKREKPYVCETCGNSFFDKAGLRRHMFTHSAVKPYICPACGKGFTKSVRLEGHIRVHTGERPFRCQICDSGFTQKQFLSKHVKKQHKETQ